MFFKSLSWEKILLFILFFTEMFSVKFGSFNTRYIVIVFWLIVAFFRAKCVKLCDFGNVFIIGAATLFTYSNMVLLFNNSDDFFVIMRFIRAMLTYITIFLFIESTSVKKEDILDIIENILKLHALCILIEIVYPPVKLIVQPISQYNKEFMFLRASGFMSGYDDAGMLLVIGFIINYYKKKFSKKNILTPSFVIYILAALFVSRMGMMVMYLFLFFVLCNESKNESVGKKFILFLMFVVGGGVSLLFWILTTDIAISFRDELMHEYPLLQNLYDNLVTSYTDYGTYGWRDKTRHWHPEDISFLQCIFGKGVWPSQSDVGYVKNIYSVGIIGVIVVVLTYVVSFFKYKKAVFCSGVECESKNNYVLMYGAIVLVMLIMEFKVSILFSSTSFELLSILYISGVSCENNKSSF